MSSPTSSQSPPKRPATARRTKKRKNADEDKHSRQEDEKSQRRRLVLAKQTNFDKWLVCGATQVADELVKLARTRAEDGFFYADALCHHKPSQTASEWITWAQESAVHYDWREGDAVRTLFACIDAYLEHFGVVYTDRPESHYPDCSSCNETCQLRFELRWKCCCRVLGRDECDGCD